jgi:allantoin racemase
MKIGVLGSYGDSVPPEVLAVIGHGVTAAFYKPRVAAFAFSPAEFAIQQLSYLETGLRAAADGCDAIVYNSCSDYGIEALRASVAVPVVGAGEAMLAVAAQLGARFSIVTVWPASTNFMPRALIAERRLENRLASIRNVSAETLIESDGRPDSFIAGMQSGTDGTLQRIVAQANAAVTEDGAELVLVGCTCMSPIAGRIAEACPVPVVNPLTAAMTQAESRLRLGIGPLAAPSARAPSLALVTRMVDAVADATIPVDCPVCVASWD